MNVSDIGEQGLLERLHQFCPPHLVGDDAAVLSVPSGYNLVVTTDVLVDGVHFSLGRATPGVFTTSAADVGWRASAANLSDLAAMGAIAQAITVGLSLPGDFPVAQVEELYGGIADCLAPHNAVIAGGDICRSPIVSVAIAAFGYVRPRQALLRTAAQPGDVVVVTGVHGASRGGLELLLQGQSAESQRLPPGSSGSITSELSANEREFLIRAHQRPRPRLDVVALLHDLNAFDRSRSLAGMDSSDGLADAVVQLCKKSGVGAWLDYGQIPMPDCLSRWRSPKQAMQWALYGGEDFELVLCVPEDLGQALVKQLGSDAAIIGYITDEPRVVLGDRSGRHDDQILSLTQGFQHF
ncbi:MAG: thiamine-phosphate kinase [Elainellaceae cyanobacterium]